MYRQSIFISLSILICFNIETAFAVKNKNQIPSKSKTAVVKSEVVQMFESYLKETQTKPLVKKIEGLTSLKKLIQSYRKSKASATPEDEIFMDTLEGVMNTFPTDGSFKLSECKNYRSLMQSQFRLDGMGEKNSVATEYAELWHHLCDE